MITLFTTAKPFRGRTAAVQRNALRSWQMLHGDVQIILFGDAEGTQEVAWELGLRYEEHPMPTAGGSVPLDYMFAKAQHAARYTALCYVACDTVLLPDFCEAFNRVEALYPEFVMVGRSQYVRRCDLQLFDDPAWQDCLTERIQRETKLQFGGRIAYLAFSRGLYLNDVPAFPASAPLALNWLVRKAIAEGVAVVDASEMVLALRQSGDGRATTGEMEAARQLEAEMLALGGRRKHLRGAAHAPYRLTQVDVVRNRWERVRHWGERVQRWKGEALQAWLEVAQQSKKATDLAATQEVRGNSMRR